MNENHNNLLLYSTEIKWLNSFCYQIKLINLESMFYFQKNSISHKRGFDFDMIQKCMFFTSCICRNITTLSHHSLPISETNISISEIGSKGIKTPNPVCIFFRSNFGPKVRESSRKNMNRPFLTGNKIPLIILHSFPNKWCTYEIIPLTGSMTRLVGPEVFNGPGISS